MQKKEFLKLQPMLVDAFHDGRRVLNFFLAAIEQLPLPRHLFFFTQRRSTAHLSFASGNERDQLHQPRRGHHVLLHDVTRQL